MEWRTKFQVQSTLPVCEADSKIYPRMSSLKYSTFFFPPKHFQMHLFSLGLKKKKKKKKLRGRSSGYSLSSLGGRNLNDRTVRSLAPGRGDWGAGDIPDSLRCLAQPPPALCGSPERRIKAPSLRLELRLHSGWLREGFLLGTRMRFPNTKSFSLAVSLVNPSC